MEDEEYIKLVTQACADKGHVYSLNSCRVCNGDDLDE